MSGPTVAFGARNLSRGLTVSADFYHIDLRNITRGRDVKSFCLITRTAARGPCLMALP